MADLERGQRIKSRRVELHLTQPALVDKLEELAKALPETHALHPAKAGKPPVTLRGVQTWEQGGGIAWEKAKLLADALQTDVQVMMHGARGETPTPFESENGATPDGLADRLDAIEHRLERIELMLLGKADSMLVSGDVLTGQLDRLERALTGAISESVTAETEEWKRLAQELVQGPSKGQTDSPPAPQRTAAARSKRAAKQRTP